MFRPARSPSSLGHSRDAVAGTLIAQLVGVVWPGLTGDVRLPAACAEDLATGVWAVAWGSVFVGVGFVFVCLWAPGLLEFIEGHQEDFHPFAPLLW